MAVTTVLFLATILGACWIVKSSENYETSTCVLRELNFTAVGQDSNGFKCKQKIRTVACFGTCDTTEYGSYLFPPKADSQAVCNFERSKQRIVMLSDCEPEAGMEARKYVFTEALSCSCAACDPKTTNCVTGVTQKRKRLGGRMGIIAGPPSDQFVADKQSGEDGGAAASRMGGSYDWRKPMKVSTRIRLLTRAIPVMDYD